MQNFETQEQLLQKRLAQAQAMRDQEFTPAQGQIVGGHFVRPDMSSALVQGLRAYRGMKESGEAEQQLKDLQTQKQQAMQGDMSAMLAALRGKPAETLQPATAVDDDGNANPTVQMPAQPGSVDKFYEAAIKSQFPQFQQMGMQGAITSAQEQAKAAQAQQQQARLMQILQSAKSPQEAIAAGVPVEAVKSYYESPNYGKNKGIAVNGQIVDPITGNKIGGPIPKQPDLSSDLLIPDPVTGKLVPNTQLIGVKRDLANAGKTVVNQSVNTGQKGFDNTLKLRGDFRSEPVYKAHQEMQAAYSQIGAGLKQGTPVGDLASATKIMKLLDPGSVVRESELGMAMAASGLADRLSNYAQNVISGNKLTPKQRKDFQALADQLYQESVNQYNAKRGEYSQIASRNELNVEDVIGSEPKVPSPKANNIDALLEKYK